MVCVDLYRNPGQPCSEIYHQRDCRTARTPDHQRSPASSHVRSGTQPCSRPQPRPRARVPLPLPRIDMSPGPLRHLPRQRESEGIRYGEGCFGSPRRWLGPEPPNQYRLRDSAISRAARQIHQLNSPLEERRNPRPVSLHRAKSHCSQMIPLQWAHRSQSRMASFQYSS